MMGCLLSGRGNATATETLGISRPAQSIPVTFNRGKSFLFIGIYPAVDDAGGEDDDDVATYAKILEA